MSTTNKYAMDLTDYGTVGWNALLKGDIEDVDDFLHTRIAGSCGATLEAGDIVYLDSSGKYSLSAAEAGKVPAIGFALAGGNADDDVLIARLGPWVGFSSGMTVGAKLYVCAGTPGQFKETKPAAFAQSVAKVLNATDIFIWVEDLDPVHYGTGDAPTPTGYPEGTLYFKYTA